MPEVKITILDSNRQALGELDVADHATFPLALNWAVADLKDISRRTGAYSKTFKVPATKNNNRLLKYIYKAHLAYEDVVCGNLATVQVSGLPVFEGKLRVKGVTQAEDPESYELELAGDNLDWVYLLKEKSIRDIAFGNEEQHFDRLSGIRVSVPASDHSHTYNINTVEASWQFFPDNFDYVYGLKNYGAWPHRDFVTVEDLRPDVSIRKIFLQSLTDAGYQVVSSFWNSNYARRLVLAYTGEGFTLPAGANNDVLFKAKNSTKTQFSGRPGGFTGSANARLDVQVCGQHFDVTDYMYHVPRRCKMCFKATVTVDMREKWENLEYLTFAVGILRSNGTWDEPVSDTPHFTKKEVVKVELDSGWIKVNQSERVALRYRYKTTGYVANSKSPVFDFTDFSMWNEVSTDIVQGNTYHVASTLPDISQLDMLSALSNLFNLYFKTDVVEKVIYCEPKEQFLKGRSKAIDWSRKLDVGRELKTEYLDNYKRTLIFKYKTDSGDGYDKDWTKTNERYAGSLKFTLPPRYVQGEHDMGNKLFAYTHTFADRSIAGSAGAPVIPRLWEKPEAVPEVSHNFEPRILYYEGLVFNEFAPNIFGFPVPVGWHWTTRQRLTGAYPKLTMRGLHYDGTGGLIDTYYRTDIQQLTDGRIIHAWLYLKPTDILMLDLRKPVYLDHASYRGYYYINKVVDHQPLLAQPTRVELIPMEGLTPATIDLSDNVDVEPRKRSALGIATGDAEYAGAGKVGEDTETPSTVLNNNTGNWAIQGAGSVAIGNGLVAAGKNQHLLGSWNAVNATDIFQVGAGTGEGDRYRALTFTAEGNFLVQGGYLYTSDGQEILFASGRNPAGAINRFDKLHLKGDQ